MKNFINSIYIFSIILSFCTNPSEKSNQKHDKIIKTVISSDNLLRAEIKTNESEENYYLSISKINNKKSIIFDSIICNKGYHVPQFFLQWTNKNKRLKITIDNDFGDNLSLYTFDIRSKRFKKLE